MDPNNDNGVVIEGITAVSACFKALDNNAPSRKIDEILVDECKLHGNDRARRRISYLRAKSAEYDIPLRYCASEYMNEITGGNTHGGIALRAQKRYVLSVESAKLPPKGFFMLFDGIEDPYSFGYSIRSLYAAGADGIVVSGTHLIDADGIISRSSAGAYELMPIYNTPNGALQAANHFRESGYKLLCSEIRDSISCTQAKLSLPLLIIMGGEKRGISSAMRSVCDGAIRIEYGRPFMGSLSTACAVSVLAFEVLRQTAVTKTMPQL